MVRIRKYSDENGKEHEVVDFQKRVWVAILYDDNKLHLHALELMEQMSYCLIMKHDRSLNRKGEVKKVHYHVLIDRTMWLFQVLDTFDLELSDAHLFHGCQEFYKSKNEAIEYYCHLNYSHKEHYDPELFKGGLSEYAINYIREVDQDRDARLLEIMQFINKFYVDRCYLRMQKLFDYCAENNSLDIYISKQSLLVNIVRDNNNCIRDELPLYSIDK